MEIKVPYLAEGVNSGTVVSILVSIGDSVKKDQTVLELETNKATAPIPSPQAGVVAKIHVKEGEEVTVGQTLITIDESGTEKSGPAFNETRTEKQKQPAPTSRSAPKTLPQPATEETGYVYASKSGFPPPAAPSVRKVARELGIDLIYIQGSERGGRVTMEDLRRYVESLKHGISPVAQAQAPEKSMEKPEPPRIDFSKWGPVERKSVSATRRTVGSKMYESWTSIPHVTQFDEADITALMALRKKYEAAYESKGGRLTVTSFILKVVVGALKKYPLFNSSYDETTREIVFKKYYHVGVAVDTEQGLLVPVIRNADQKSILELSIELQALAEKTRQKKISIEELQGGSFTISNLGSIGGSYFTPIINQPEVAVLGVARGVTKPVSAGGKIESRALLPLCLSYDHRVIDGADGARFIRALVEGLEHFDENEVMG